MAQKKIFNISALSISRVWRGRLAVGILSIGVAFSIEWGRPALIMGLDEGVRDVIVRTLASSAVENRVAVVDISEVALKEIGPWPWTRGQVADLVEILLGPYQAKTVALDIVFPEAGDLSGDTRLEALAAYGPVTLAQLFDFTNQSQPIAQGLLVSGKSATPNEMLRQARGFIANHKGLVEARCVGNIGFEPDPDGVLRHLPLRAQFDNSVYAGFAPSTLQCSGELKGIYGGGKDGVWRVPYSRNFSSYTVVNAADVLYERLPNRLLSDRHILVGSSALGLGDRVSTPLTPVAAGVMVHAASLTGLLDMRDGLVTEPWSGRMIAASWVVASIILAVAGLARLPAWGGLLVLLGLSSGWMCMAVWGVSQQVECSVTAPLWGYFILITLGVPLEWWQAQQRARRVLNTFSHYVAKPVLDEIVRQNLMHSLKPTLADVTVLIADMQGYTQATSALSLDEAAALTKDFLGCLTHPVLEWHGTLDKYTGDGLVAFWGAPLACPNQADRAVGAALDILAEVDAFNARRQVRGFTPVRVRIGIESGRALVGDLGTAFRSTYTAVGDCINFASRLEAAARDLPTQLVIGSATNAQLVQHRTRSLGTIGLRGTQTKIDIFTVDVDQ